MSTDKKSLKKIILQFLPLLIIYVSIVLAFSPDQLVGDELRHMRYTTNLTNGYYAEADNPSLRNGPGYPLLIALPVLIDAPYLLIRLLNVPFLFLAVLFFYKTLRFYINHKKAIILSFIFGLYPPTLKYMSGILSESLVLFLVCGFLYFFLKLHREYSKKTLHIMLSASFMGFLALTKIIFGYVILTLAAFYLISFLLKRSNKAKHSLIVLVMSFMFCIPYLMYTYSVTGKAFVWGTQGGEMLYWRSSPFSEEQGNWTSMESVIGDGPTEYLSNAQLFENHGEFLQKLEPLSFVKRDSLFKVKAMENIRNHPDKYVKNTASSLARLFFNYPYSYMPQKLSTLFYMVPNMFLLIFLFFAVGIASFNKNQIPFEIRFLILSTLIFMGGLTLLDGRVRHLTPAIPTLLFLIGFTFNQFTDFKIKGVPFLNRTDSD